MRDQLIDLRLQRGGDGDPRAALLQEYVALIALIRDAGIDRAQLRAILARHPETRPAGDDNPHPPLADQ